MLTRWSIEAFTESDYVSPSVAESGKRLFVNGHVTDMEVSSRRGIGTAKAKVLTSRSVAAEYYEVQVTDDGKVGSCKCKADDDYYCQHQVALGVAAYCFSFTPYEMPAELKSILAQTNRLTKQVNRGKNFMSSEKKPILCYDDLRLIADRPPGESGVRGLAVIDEGRKVKMVERDAASVAAQKEARKAKRKAERDALKQLNTKKQKKRRSIVRDDEEEEEEESRDEGTHASRKSKAGASSSTKSSSESYRDTVAVLNGENMVTGARKRRARRDSIYAFE